MLKKTIITGFAIMIAFFAFQPIENAEAKTRVHIGVGVGGYGYGGPYYGPGYGYGGYGPYYGPGYYGPGYYNPRPYYGGHYAPRRAYRGRRISCKRAKRIVRNHGYHRVRARDCRGKTYSFSGRKRGRTYIIKLRSRTGRIFKVFRR